MEHFIKDLCQNYKLDKYTIKDDVIIFRISSELSSAICPYCGYSSNKVHSTYEREIQDLPMQNKRVILLVQTRKFFCKNDQCSKKTFSEKHSFVNANGKKTVRLEENIIYTSTQLSSLSASKILKSNHISIGKSSICNLLKKNAINCG